MVKPLCRAYKRAAPATDVQLCSPAAMAFGLDRRTRVPAHPVRLAFILAGLKEARDRLIRDCRGSSTTEYAIIAAVVGAGIVLAMANLKSH